MNWKVRIRNKRFWMTIVPAVILCIQAVLAVFGMTIDLTDISGKLLAAVDAVFTVLAVIGIVNDPTTEGFTDSEQAMTYEVPKPKK